MARVTSDVAYDYIRKRILNGEFPMGHALTTSALSSEIGISRTPVRDALRQLEADGLVEIEPHFGANVRMIDINEFRELCMMRLALESLLAGVAAEERTDSDLREIGMIMSNLRKLSDEFLAGGDDREETCFPQLMREDVRFHIAIMTAARKPHIKKEVLRLHLINRVVTWERRTEATLGLATRAIRDSDCRDALVTHEQIYRAIVEGQREEAKKAMAHHIQKIIDTVLERLRDVDTKLLSPRQLTEDEELYSG